MVSTCEHAYSSIFKLSHEMQPHYEQHALSCDAQHVKKQPKQIPDPTKDVPFDNTHLFSPDQIHRFKARVTEKKNSKTTAAAPTHRNATRQQRALSEPPPVGDRVAEVPRFSRHISSPSPTCMNTEQERSTLHTRASR